MNLVKRDTAWYPSLINDFFTRDLVNDTPFFSTALPAVNIQEQETTFELELAVPGLEKKDLEITVEEDTLVIASQKRVAQEADGKYTRKEFGYHSFRRAFALPDSVDPSKISASVSSVGDAKKSIQRCSRR